MRLLKTGFVLIVLPLVALPAAAQTAALPAAESDLETVIAEARAWVTKPATDGRIEAFSRAADIRYREYQKPRPLRVWIIRVDLTAPGVRLAVTQPLTGEPRKLKEETRSASTLDFARQRGVQLAVNASAFDPFRSRTGMPMNVVGLAAVRLSRATQRRTRADSRRRRPGRIRYRTVPDLLVSLARPLGLTNQLKQRRQDPGGAADQLLFQPAFSNVVQ